MMGAPALRVRRRDTGSPAEYGISAGGNGRGLCPLSSGGLHAQAGADNVIGTVWGRGYMMRDAVTAQPAAAKAQPAAVPRAQALAHAA